ncbi:acyl-CoA N-acyltransferase [Limtongia smithiae]|uniref:acyl-CoA N-acyltransferase n=1 Tax=Limtongia smithiae TaxID=1125753 RepID=UPI0034CDC030
MPLLFPATESFISPAVAAAVAPAYILRPLSSSDYAAGVLDVLKDLTTVGDISEDKFLAHFEFMKARPGEYFMVVFEKMETRKVVAVGTLLVERKFIHECGLVGHIEDIAVAKSEQGKHLGKHLIEALDHIGKASGCYKNILDCSPHNEKFYEKCGYTNGGFEMVSTTSKRRKDITNLNRSNGFDRLQHD